jgi:integrase
MASVSKDRYGNRIVQFTADNGKRRTIRVGTTDMKTARDIARRVDVLNVAKIAGQPIDREMAEWLGAIGNKLHARLVTAGLVGPRDPVAAAPLAPTLGAFLAEFVAKRAGEKASTLSSIDLAIKRLVKYFGADVLIDSITAGQADDWLTWLKVTKKYASATIGRTVKHAKRFFRSAVRLKLLPESPFADLRSRKQTNDARKFFVTLETTSQVLDALPDAEWRLIFALSRYGGLRCPSEHLALTWPDVDWARDRFLARAPKTGVRWVPIFAELRPYLAAAFEAAPDGAMNVITRRRASAQRWGVLLERSLARAGIQRWERIFHNLRASRQTELTAVYSIGTVCRWLGNSVEVADQHYLTALESEFERAAREGATGKALQKALHQSETNRDKPLQTGTGDLAGTLEFAESAKKHPEACKSQGG